MDLVMWWLWVILFFAQMAICANLNINFLTNRRKLERDGFCEHPQPKVWKLAVINLFLIPSSIIFWMIIGLKVLVVESTAFLWDTVRDWYYR